MRPRPLSTTLATALVMWTLGVALSFSAACARGTGEGGDMPNDDAAHTLGAASGVRIDQPTVAASLKTASSAAPLRQAVRSAGQVRLSLGGITVSRPPGVLFNVYLATAGPHPQRQYVGTLSFYGVEGAGTVNLPERNFDVTEPLKALLGKGDALPDLQVVFEATDGTAGSTVAKAAPSFNRDSGLKVGTVRLQRP